MQLTLKSYIMKTQTIITPTGKTLRFIPSNDFMSILEVDSMAFDFEIHHHHNNLVEAIAFREFHIDSEDPATRAIEQALLTYCLSFSLFELYYEDGIPCLTHTFGIEI